jgi:hypothetical protein
MPTTTVPTAARLIRKRRALIKVNTVHYPNHFRGFPSALRLQLMQQAEFGSFSEIVMLEQLHEKYVYLIGISQLFLLGK